MHALLKCFHHNNMQECPPYHQQQFTQKLPTQVLAFRHALGSGPQQAGHDDVAQQIEAYRNARNERSGWDAWLKSNFPALWDIYETGD